MNILVVDQEGSSSEFSEELYIIDSDAYMDVRYPSEIDFESEADKWNAVLSEAIVDEERCASDIFEELEASEKIIYTTWREEDIEEFPEGGQSLIDYPVIYKPLKNFDLKSHVNKVI